MVYTNTSYNAGYGNYTMDYMNNLTKFHEQQAMNQYNNLSVFSNSGINNTTSYNTNELIQTQNTHEGCTDGNDDGKVGFFEGAWSCIKGVGHGLENMVKGALGFDESGNWNPLNLLKTAVTVGACFIPGVGPFIGAGLCGIGLVKGGVGIVKNAMAAANATTDAEAKAALEGCGSSALTAAASYVGLRGSVGVIAKNASIEGGLSQGVVKNVVQMAKKGSGTGKFTPEGLGKTALKSANKLGETTYSEAFNTAKNANGGGIKGTFKGAANVVKEGGKGTVNNVATAAKAVKNTFFKKKNAGEGTSAEIESAKEFNSENYGNHTLEDIVKQIDEKQAAKINFSELEEGSTLKLTDAKGVKYTVKIGKEGNFTVKQSAYTTKTRVNEFSLTDKKGKSINLEDVVNKNQLPKEVAKLTSENPTFENNGIKYELNGDTLKITSSKTKNISNAGYQIRDTWNKAEGYQGLPEKGNVPKTVFTLNSVYAQDAQDIAEDKLLQTSYYGY